MGAVMKLKVRGYHCDFYGHVNNARYLEFLEEARWSYLEGGIDLAAWQEQGRGFVVAGIDIRYRRPAGLNAELEIRSTLDSLGEKTGDIRQQVLDAATGKVVAEAVVTFAVIDLGSGKAVPMGQEIRRALQACEGP